LDSAVLLCFVTDMDQIGGRRGLSVPAFFAGVAGKKIYNFVVDEDNYAMI